MELKTNIDSGDVKISRNLDGTETQIKEEPDLATRVAQTKEEPKEEPTGVKKPEFNSADIDNIKDPEAKAWAQKAYKSFEKGYQEKFQELAEVRKSLEAKKEPSTWTPERLQQEMNKPDFVQAANNVLQTQPKDDDSILSESEKQKMKNLENEVRNLKQQSLVSSKIVQDEQLKSKYANYNPEAVDILTADLIAGKVQATREHLYKVLDYDAGIRRAYELGKSDKKIDNVEKINSMSTDGKTVVGDSSVPKIEEGESNKNYFLRLASRRFQQSKESGQIRK